MIRLFWAALAVVFTLTACGGGGGGGTPPVATVSPTPFPGGSPPSTQSLSCPSSASSAQSFASAPAGTATFSRMTPRASGLPGFVPGAIAVTYRVSARTSDLERAARTLGASRRADLTFDALGLRTRVLSVDPSRTDAAMVQLRSAQGVESVSRISYRHLQTVSSNDPYYIGFGPGAPYYESASEPGQWDMHVMHVSTAWNDVTSSAPVTGAPIAIVDTGVDVNHPELSGGKIVRTQCYVTYPSSASQSSGPFVTDTDGHGTDVAGIADANTGNGLGFASPGFSAPMLAYRIFPTDPSAGCEGSTSAQCESNTFDEASAINDAVAHGAKVINLSLGSTGPCSSSDPEYQAIENAIAKGVVVVAAAGNESKSALDCPAADPGVIAVGASTLDDAVSPAKEAVATYSNFVSGTSGGRYMVAPGGDPSGSRDNDDLHWIENIYSSTAVQPGTCTPDNGSSSATADCRILIAGTSQATPHVAGVVSLILAARPGYSPVQVAAALCNSATDISDSKQGCGRVDAAAAVAYAKSH